MKMIKSLALVVLLSMTAQAASVMTPSATIQTIETASKSSIETKSDFHDQQTGLIPQVYNNESEILESLHKYYETNVKRPMRVLFLSSDTGGGHRASAESLAKQFQRLYPGTQYDLLDIWTMDGCYPYKTLVESYKHLSAHPRQWKWLYHISNSRPYEIMVDIHSTLTCKNKIRKRILSYKPDVVVSVHPAMNNVPLLALRDLEKSTGLHIPLFTVVTDFGSGHTTWFQKGVEKIYVASDRIRKLCKRRGRIPNNKIVQSGLPIRRDFAVQVDAMGDRTSPSGHNYQRKMKQKLGMDPNTQSVLVMGGGEGVGSLEQIVNNLYVELTAKGIDATIAVVCGRNEKLRKELEVRSKEEWDAIYEKKRRVKKRRHLNVFSPLFPQRFKQSVKIAKRIAEEKIREEKQGELVLKGKVDILPIGFVTNIAEYMVAADILLTKAGPGTIAEAAAVGLPVMLTSFLPGQEAGNVDIVIDGGFGDFCEIPSQIAEEVGYWLKDKPMLKVMSQSAMKIGAPHAAEEIVSSIGEITHKWMEANNVLGRTKAST